MPEIGQEPTSGIYYNTFRVFMFLFKDLHV